MNAEWKLLCKILQDGDLTKVRTTGIDLSYFKEVKLITIWKFIEQHYEDYRVVPSAATVEQKFDVQVDKVSEPIEYWLSEIQNQKIEEEIIDVGQSINGFLTKGEPRKALEFLVDFSKDSLLKFHSGTKKSFTARDLAAKVWTAYEDAKAGKMGFPTPWQTLNEWTMGWFKKDISFFVARSGIGKCHPKGTEVLMHDGSYKKVEEIQVGDKLMGPDSRSRTVLSTAKGEELLYEVIPMNGEKWGCNESHILSLVCSVDKNKKFKKGRKYNLTVKEYLLLPKRIQRNLKLWKVPVEFKKVRTKYDPYFVGLWIGDGTVDRPEITKNEPELDKYLKTFCKENNLVFRKLTPKNRCSKYTFTSKEFKNPLRDYLKTLFVNKEKRIPKEYLVNSRVNRLKMLAGLLDTDGHKINKGYEFVTKYIGLREDVLFLARSLGYRVSHREKFVNGRAYYRIFIFGNLMDLPILIKRKKPEKRLQTKDPMVSGFKLVKKKVGTYYGFEISGDHLYLLKDFTVTHNTFLLIDLAQAVIAAGHSVLFISCEMSAEDIAQRYFAGRFKINYGGIRKGKLGFMDEQSYKVSLQGYGGTNDLEIYDGSMGLHMNDVEMAILSTKAEFVIIDSCYRITARQKAKDRFDNMAYVVTDLKMLAQLHDRAIVASTQLNRDFKKKKKDEALDLTDIALSDVISWTSTNVFALSKHEEEKTKKVTMRAYPLKIREGENQKKFMELNWDFVKMDFSEVSSSGGGGGVKTIPGNYTDPDKDDDDDYPW